MVMFTTDYATSIEGVLILTKRGKVKSASEINKYLTMS